MHELRVLRQRHPSMTYCGLTLGPDSVTYRYHLAGHGELATVHRFHGVPRPAEGELLHLVGLVELLSYWKSCCAPEVVVEPALGSSALRLFGACLDSGMGEFYARNSIDPSWPGFVTVRSGGPAPAARAVTAAGDDCLLLDSGGKDSAVARLLLSDTYRCTSLNVTTNRQGSAACRVERWLDPALAALNGAGYLNGHVPFSAVLALLGAAVAKELGAAYCCAANERSSDSCNMVHLGRPTNHQWSKSYAFETLCADYLADRGEPVSYFSPLRPIWDLQSSAIAARHGFLETSVSCNRTKGDGWCLDCPKCLSSFLTMAPFTGYDRAVRICGGSPLDRTGAAATLRSLLGLSANRPWECIAVPFEIRFGLRSVRLPDALAGDREIAAALDGDIATPRLDGVSGEHRLPPALLARLQQELGGCFA